LLRRFAPRNDSGGNVIARLPEGKRGNLSFKVKGALSDYGFHPFSPKESFKNKIFLAYFFKII
jgi:hypothetical protein